LQAAGEAAIFSLKCQHKFKFMGEEERPHAAENRENASLGRGRINATLREEKNPGNFRKDAEQTHLRGRGGAGTYSFDRTGAGASAQGRRGNQIFRGEEGLAHLQGED
jgi:hypothetical protein